MSKSAKIIKPAATKESNVKQVPRTQTKGATQAVAIQKRNRFVVIGFDPENTNALFKDGEGNQGGGDPGKQGLPTSPMGLFQDGVVSIKGQKPPTRYGAIEFPSAGAAFAWIYSRQGEAFCKDYKRVFIQATFA